MRIGNYLLQEYLEIVIETCVQFAIVIFSIHSYCKYFYPPSFSVT